MPERKYQDVEKLLEQNPGMTIPEAGRKLGYKQELQNKGQGRVGLRNRQVDQKRAEAESMQRGEATRYKPPKVSGFDQHHKRMIMLYRPLYEGLSDADALELSKYAAAQGMPLGDVEDNYELLSTGPGGQHNQLHRYMEQQGMRPSDMPDFSKADLDNRKKAFDVLYKDFIQADIDKKASLLLKGGGVRTLVRGFGKVGDALTAVPVIGKVGVALTAVGALSDAADATTGTYGAVTKTGKEQTAAGLNAASGVLGLASLAVPPLAGAAAALGGVGMLAENRIERDKRRERDTDIKAGRIQPKRPDPYTTTITKREPSTLKKITSDPLNELEYLGKKAFSFFGAAVRLASPLGL
jgi:hypothetical protein